MMLKGKLLTHTIVEPEPYVELLFDCSEQPFCDIVSDVNQIRSSVIYSDCEDNDYTVVFDDMLVVILSETLKEAVLKAYGINDEFPGMELHLTVY